MNELCSAILSVSLYSDYKRTEFVDLSATQSHAIEATNNNAFNLLN